MEKIEGEVTIPWGFQTHECYNDPERRKKMGMREIKKDVLARDIPFLNGLFQDILETIEVVDAHNQDKHLTKLKRKLQPVLNRGYNTPPINKCEEEGQTLNDLLEFTITTAAEIEKLYPGLPLDRFKEMRKKIRRFLKAQFEGRRQLIGKIEINLLSKT